MFLITFTSDEGQVNYIKKLFTRHYYFNKNFISVHFLEAETEKYSFSIAAAFYHFLANVTILVLFNKAAFITVQRVLEMQQVGRKIIAIML